MLPKIIQPDSYNPENGKRDIQQEYILCAALRRKSPRVCDCGEPYHPGINDILDIEIGFRHHDIYLRFPDEVSIKLKDQGFYTSHGRFVEREEAMKIAYEAGQISAERAFVSIEMTDYTEDNYKDIFGILFSEDLY